jgi:polysaccharide deacetylase family protein (PEP-CTERM system associated)
MRKHILTIDVEEWYHGNYHSFDPSQSNLESRVESNTNAILEFLQKTNTKATFFILGEVAEKNPNLIKNIHQLGHEIGSHGYSHNLVYQYNKHEFKADVYRSKSFLEDTIGHSIIGYRAPSWSVNKQITWFYEILEELGFLYSSSVFPIQTYMYGIKDSPRFKHIPDSKYSIFEIPCSTYQFWNLRIPFSGGFYIRILPKFVIQSIFKYLWREPEPILFYFHPREIDPDQPNLKLFSKLESFIHHHGIHSCRNKFKELTESIQLTSIEDYFQIRETTGVNH